MWQEWEKYKMTVRPTPQFYYRQDPPTDAKICEWKSERKQDMYRVFWVFSPINWSITRKNTVTEEKSSPALTSGLNLISPIITHLNIMYLPISWFESLRETQHHFCGILAKNHNHTNQIMSNHSKPNVGTSLAVQWLRVCTSKARGHRFEPWSG